MRNFAISLICLIIALTYDISGAEQTYVYEALFFPREVPITIDGDLSDWEILGAGVENLDNICQAVGKAKLLRPRSKADLSAKFRAVADPDNFYVAVEVNDDRLIFGESRFGEAHEDDSVEIYFDEDRKVHSYSDSTENFNITHTDYDANDAEIRVSVDEAGNVQLEGMGLFGGRLVMLPGLWESLGITAAVKKNLTGYRAELKVPKIVFVSVPLRPGVRIGFNVMVNDDDDGDGRDSKVSWTADLFDQSWLTTKHFGQLLLIPSPSSRNR